MTEPSTPVRLATFAEFYPFYLGEHPNRTCRRLHFVGIIFGLGCFLAAGLSYRHIPTHQRLTARFRRVLYP